MKPQDIVMLVAILSYFDRNSEDAKEAIEMDYSRWSIQELADLLELSLSVVHRSVKSASRSKLLDLESGKVNRRRFFEFIIHSIGILYPAEIKGPTEGISTTLSAGVFPANYSIQAGEQGFVWPHPMGVDAGLELSPIHRSATTLSLKSPFAHKILAACDSIRLERPREKALATDYLRTLYL